MKKRTGRLPSKAVAMALLATFVLLPLTSSAQDRLKTMPGYDQYQRMSKEIPGSVKPGSLTAKWRDGGKALTFQKDGKAYRYDIASGQTSETGQATGEAGDSGMGRR